MINVGIIGLGFGQAVHLPALLGDPRVSVRALCATRLDKAKGVAQRFNIPATFATAEEMLKSSDIQAISVAVPPPFQAAIVEAALKAKKHIFCEKPLAAGGKRGKELAAAFSNAKLAHMIDFPFPELDSWAQCKQLIEGGKIGDLRHIAINWQLETYANRNRIATWKRDKEAGGGTFNSFASHTLHYLEWFLGPISALNMNDFKTDEALSLGFEFTSGAKANAFISTVSPGGAGHTLEITGSSGTLLLHTDHSKHFPAFTLSFRGPDLGPWQQLIAEPQDLEIFPTAILLKRFIDWIDTGTETRPSLYAGARVDYLMEQAKESATTRQWISAHDS